VTNVLMEPTKCLYFIIRITKLLLCFHIIWKLNVKYKSKKAVIATDKTRPMFVVLLENMDKATRHAISFRQLSHLFD